MATTSRSTSRKSASSSSRTSNSKKRSTSTRRKTSASHKKASSSAKKTSSGGQACWPGFKRVPGTKAGTKGSCEKKAHQTAGEKKADSRAAAASKREKGKS